MNSTERENLIEKIAIYKSEAAVLLEETITQDKSRFVQKYDIISNCVDQILEEIDRSSKVDSQKELNVLERYPKDFSKKRSHIEQANRMLEEDHYELDERDWGQRRCLAILKYRDSWLKEIVEQNIENEKDLAPIHIKALDNMIKATDLNMNMRYKIRVDYLKMMVNELINDLMFNIYKSDHDSMISRQNDIRQLHELHTDLRKIKESDKCVAWEMVNEAWGVDTRYFN